MPKAKVLLLRMKVLNTDCVTMMFHDVKFFLQVADQPHLYGSLKANIEHGKINLFVSSYVSHTDVTEGSQLKSRRSSMKL